MEEKLFMKNVLKIFCAVLFLSLNSNLFAQSEDEMKAWMAYMTPGDIHKMISTSDGDWSEDITIWMSPDAPPQTMKGSCNNKMILGGRYQYSTHSGNMMGMPFEGIGILAYDNAKQLFQSSWVDNMGTGITYMTGPWDPSTNTITLTGTMVDPLTDKDVQLKQVFKIIDANNQMLEMYDNKSGQEIKTMEIKLTRN
jgi:Protein of unknown function (DUF1579)